MFTSISRQNQTLGGEENMLAIQVNVRYILKHLKDRKALTVHIYYIWCDIILIFKLPSFFKIQFENSNDVIPV